MRGSKNYKMDIHFLNSIYEHPKKIDFLRVEQEQFAQLYAVMKNLNKEIHTYYEHEDSLIDIATMVRKGVNKFFTAIAAYELVIESDLAILIEQLAKMKQQYTDLFDKFGRIIVQNLLAIKNEYSETNFLAEALLPYVNQKKKQCVVVKYESTIEEIHGLPVIKASKYLRAGEFFDEVFFIGSPDFYDSRFSQLFLSKKTYFVTYDFFQNKISRKKRFKHLKRTQQIDTLFQQVSIAKGFQGEVATVDFGEPEKEEVSTEEIVLRHEKIAKNVKEYEKVEAKLVILSNKYYTFIPVKGKMRTINRDNLTIINRGMNDIRVGEWLVFRNNSDTDLVIDVANRILGDEHQQLRKYQRAWKKKLRKAIDVNGVDKVIRILEKRGMTQANLINIGNWLSPTSIRTENFEILLTTLQFKAHHVQLISEAMQKLTTVHLKAGKEITSQLMEELDEETMEIISEQGYATFTSPLMPGASFNIEIVQKIVEGTITISSADTFKIWRE